MVCVGKGQTQVSPSALLFLFSTCHSLRVGHSGRKVYFHPTNVFHDEEKSGRKEYKILNEVC